MLSSSSPVLTLEHRQTWQKRCMIALMLLSCWLAMLLPLTLPVRLGMSILSCGIVTAGLRQLGWIPNGSSIARVVWQQSGDWRLLTADGTAITAQLAGSSFVSQWLLVLHWHCMCDDRQLPSQSTVRLMVLRGEMSVQGWRRWQTRLRLQGMSVPRDGIQVLS